MFVELRGPFSVAGPLEVDPDGSEQMEWITDETFDDIGSATKAIQKWIAEHGREPGDIFDESFRPALHVRIVWANTYEEFLPTQIELEERGIKQRVSRRRESLQAIPISILFVVGGAWMIREGNTGIGWMAVVFFGAGGLLILLNIMRGDRGRSGRDGVK